jgi:uncharacterized Rossmann fold enzyme
VTTVTDVSTVSEQQQTADLRSRIFGIDDIPVEMVDVPEWGVTIEVRGMTGGDRAAIMQEIGESGSVDFTTFYPDVVIKTAYDPSTGVRIFSEGDRAAILTKAGLVVDRIASVGLRLSGMGGDKAVDEAGKPS